MEDAPESPEATRVFPCEGCGADLAYRVGSQSLACPYCGFATEICLDPEAVIAERDLESMLDRQLRIRSAESSHDPEALEVHCRECNATVVFRGTLTAKACAYCAAPIQRADVHRAEDRNPVDAVLPFSVDADFARDGVRRWLRSRWFAPASFTRSDVPSRVQGVYLPYWTFDGLTFSHYTGQRGEVERRDGESVVRWEPVDDTFQHFFDDVAECADASLPAGFMRGLEPWPWERSVPFEPAYLAGALAKTYDVPLSEGFKRAQVRVNAELQQEVKRRIGGDRQRVDSLATRWDGLTYKHVLLPVWLLSLRHGERIHHLVVNGATGEVQGERPWSRVKLALAGLAVATLVAVGMWLKSGG